MPDISTIPESSIDETYDAASVRSKRLIYRAKQRGWLEVDVLLGTWAHHNVPKLDDKALDEFEALVNTDTIEIYNLLTLRTPIPESLDNETVRSIVEWCEGQPLGKASVEGYREAKKEAGLT
jgi:succinate dehydrogenase assembly factor 2